MIKGEDINRKNLVEHLSKGFCKVQFRKQTTGRFRSLTCTLDPKQIPTKYAKALTESLSGGPNPDLLPVFDVVSRSWKSFYIPNVLYFYTEENMRGKKPEESDTEGENNAKRTPNRRKAQTPQAKRAPKKK